MQETNSFPTDLYGKPPPSLKSAVTGMANACEVFWKKHLTGSRDLNPRVIPALAALQISSINF
jgi:hypothetical protein